MELPSSTDYLRHIAYDSVIFGFSGEQLKILIMEYHNTGWFALPGGFVRTTENLNDAVKRGLKERTGLDNIYLEQFYTFGDYARHDASVMKGIMEAAGHSIEKQHWLLDRFLSIAYYALVDHRKVTLTPDHLSDSINWYPVNELPPLMLDHNAIIQKALDTLKLNLNSKLIGMNLLPTKFTMKELRKVHEAVLGEPIRRTTFQRKMLSLGILERHEKRFNGKAHKAPYLYSFVESSTS